jgi:glycosyltransferase involved in cell wall biosynthesis
MHVRCALRSGGRVQPARPGLHDTIVFMLSPMQVKNLSFPHATPHRLKLLHVITSVDPAGGGPIEGVRRIADCNVTAGHAVEVVCMDDPHSTNLKNFPVPCHALGPAHTSYAYAPRLVPWLRQNATRFDAVIANGLWQYGSLAVHRALKGSQTPYFVYTHGMLDPWFKRTYPLKHLKKWLYWPWGQYPVLRDARAVLFTCEDEKLLARQSFWLYRCNERVVRYGTPGPGPLNEARRASLKQGFLAQWPALEGKRCLLFLGRVHEKKGADLLFHAFARELKAGGGTLPGVAPHIVMAGPANHAYGQRMQALVVSLGLSEHVTWTGMLSGDEKWGAFHAADAFILPSHQENFGIAVAESLACGLPVLISKKVNIWREIVEDGAGFADDDTVEGTVRLLKLWMQTPVDQWAVMRHRALACFTQRFRIEQAATSLINTLLECGVRPRHGR